MRQADIRNPYPRLRTDCQCRSYNIFTEVIETNWELNFVFARLAG